MHLVSNVVWSQPDAWFGGFSGIEVSQNGAHITLISDRATLVVADMIRKNGQLTAVQLRSHVTLKNADGTPLTAAQADPEGLAIDNYGRAFVSFEHDHRVAQLDLKTGRVSANTRSPKFSKFQLNAGLEALAVDPQGMLFALPEQSGVETIPFPLFSFQNGKWQITHNIARRGPFLPVGADVSDDGLFYLLERALSPLGFRSRIRRFDLSASDLGEEVLITTGPGRFDNLEAISVWNNSAGQTLLTLISDDNFLAIQQTQIVEFLITE